MANLPSPEMHRLSMREREKPMSVASAVILSAQEQEPQELKAVPAPPSDCRHIWVANSGKGGKPIFSPISSISGHVPVNHAICRLCKTRTWFSESQWLKIAKVEGETRQMRRQRLRKAEKVEREEEKLRQIKPR